MTFEETGIIMDILKTAYPQFYSGPNAPDRVKTLRLWAEMFARDGVALVAAAVKALIESDSKGFPPHIGAVKEKLRFISGGNKITEAEAQCH
ncbi:replicative helicase loader/inhibitor [uncultured Oscillibacter sp.]|uniref:replicative helicase loader/inhibitor n=1 Tax=uncultured Oscillibacter sp. TaxID=876091 RepID=UPI0025E9F31E|nr:replicative helicase loader/inhibitor [uncultured Oscillibacter sp.]